MDAARMSTPTPPITHSAAFHDAYVVKTPPMTTATPAPTGAPAENVANAVARARPWKLAAMMPIALGVLGSVNVL